MLVGRDEKLSALQKLYGRTSSSIVVLYGRTGIGKTSLVREFIKDKDHFYFKAIPATPNEARLFMANCAYGPSELNNFLTSYDDIFVGITKENKVKKVIVIDEFSYLAKSDEDFMKSITAMVTNQADYGRVMVILVSSSISYVEANKNIFNKELSSLTTFCKVEELKFMDTMRFFANYSIEDCVRFFAVTGGVPQYINRISKKQPFVENICRNILSSNSYLFESGHEFVKEELRETAIYNTILGCLAVGMNKINDIYVYTGFGRDKISVYLKNLMERDIVEKVYSYDVTGKESIKKGMYRIKPGMVEFWYRYMYPNMTALYEMSTEEFYKNYIEETITDFMTEGFIRVCSEYMELLEQHDGLKIETVRNSRVYDRDKRIDIIREDKDGVSVVGYCSFEDESIAVKDYNHLLESIDNAKLNAKYIYMFSKSGFTPELIAMSNKDENLVLIDIKDL